MAHACGRCPIIESPPRKVFPGRQFSGKNSPSAARAERIFTSKLSTEGDFSGGGDSIYCVLKSIPDIFDCNLKTNYQILIIFGRNIPDITCRQMTVQFPTLPNV